MLCAEKHTMNTKTRLLHGSAKHNEAIFILMILLLARIRLIQFRFQIYKIGSIFILKTVACAEKHTINTKTRVFHGSLKRNEDNIILMILLLARIHLMRFHFPDSKNSINFRLEDTAMCSRAYHRCK